MAQTGTTLFALFGDQLLEYPFPGRTLKRHALGFTFSGAAVTLGTSSIYITCGLVNGSLSKTVYAWTGLLASIGELVHPRTHHSTVLYEDCIYAVGGSKPIERYSLLSNSSTVVANLNLLGTAICVHRSELVIFGKRFEADKYALLNIFNFQTGKYRQIQLTKSLKALNRSVCFSLDNRSVVLFGGFRENIANCITLVYDSYKEVLEPLRFEMDFEGYCEPVQVRNDQVLAVDVSGLRHVVSLRELRWELKRDIYGPEHWNTRRFALFSLHCLKREGRRIELMRLPWQLLLEVVALL